MARLSRDRIVEAAVALADERGLDGLTMRELAAALGVGTMSLYHHVADKEGLKQALAEFVWSRIAVPARDEPWERRMRSIATDLRALSRRHPSLVPLLLTRRYTRGRGLEPVEALLQAARDAGFDAAGSVVCFRTLVGFVVGSAGGETSRPGVDPAVVARALPGHALDHRFPMLAEALDASHLVDPDDEFEFGLGIVLEGFAARRPQRSAVSRSRPGRA